MKNHVTFYIKNLPTSKFIKIANFFLKGARNFLTQDLKSTIKSSSINRGQISKNQRQVINELKPVKDPVDHFCGHFTRKD